MFYISVSIDVNDIYLLSYVCREVLLCGPEQYLFNRHLVNKLPRGGSSCKVITLSTVQDCGMKFQDLLRA